MNERILSPQLLKLVQAAGPGYSQANPEWVKKFAELIVVECKENFAKVWYEQGLDIQGAELGKFLTRFEEHFGVK